MRTDSKHIALERIRAMIYLLRKSHFGQYSGEDNLLLSGLKKLQQQLRCDVPVSIEPVEVISPFLALLKAPYLAGPFKLVALDSIQTFLTCNILCEGTSDKISDALIEVVEVVSKCKFIETDAVGDEQVQLQIIQTLKCILLSHVRRYLTDSSTWTIVEFSFQLLLQTGLKEEHSMGKSSLYYNLERLLLDAVRFVFAVNLESKNSDNSNGSVNSKHGSPLLNEHVNTDCKSCTGLPCAMKVLGFFIHILHKHSSKAVPNEVAAKAAILSRSSSGNMRSFVPLNESAFDYETLELLITLKSIQAILLAEGGQMMSSRNLIMLCPPLASMVRDDLGRYLVLLCTNRNFAPSILQTSLGIFTSLLISIGPSMRLLVECFMKHVYIKSLHQLLNVFTQYEESLYGNTDIATTIPMQDLDVFTIEELELILESLSDLISDSGFLPSLFASFDCDPTKPDIIQPLIHYLSRSTRVYLIIRSKDLGHLMELGGLCLNCYNHITRTITDRGVDGGRLHSVGKIIHNLSKEERERPIPNIDKKELEIVTVAQYLQSTRYSKNLLLQASKLFINKPQECFKFLQLHGSLPTPLTPSSVAKFLRIAPGLPKENTGQYLGELGKDSKDSKYEGDTKEFHSQVLVNYVSSFELGGQSILNCMRIFLSAFWLPGEAQQIDRILVAFSEYCHQCSIEGVNGDIENPEITYLLTFSIIMLNTDRHNPNIKAERKMTVEQFILYNTNYGADVNQTIPLTRDYLEGIYSSISEYPIRTERSDISGKITHEMWMDLQLQAEIDVEKGILLSTSYPPDLIDSMAKTYKFKLHAQHSVLSYSKSSSNLNENHKENNKDNYINNIYNDNESSATFKLLNSSDVCNPFEQSSILFGAHSFLDSDLIGCIWHEMLGVAIAPFLVSRMRRYNGNRNMNSNDIYISDKSVDIRRIRIGIDLLLSLLKIANIYSIQEVIDTIILLLSEFAGFLKGHFVDSILSSLDLGYQLISIPRTQSQLSLSDPDNTTKPSEKNLIFVDNLLQSMPARAALGTYLQVIQNNPNYIESCWSVVMYSLGVLRDCLLLPRQMVIEPDADLLPPIVRSQFEARLKSSCIPKTSSVSPLSPLSEVKRRSSLLSFIGIGNSDDDEKDNVIPENDNNRNDEECPSTRWDCGYEEETKESKETTYSFNKPAKFIEDMISIELSSYNNHSELNINNDSVKFRSYAIKESTAVEDIANALKSVRELIFISGVTQIIGDTRFLNDDSLINFFDTLIDTIEYSDLSIKEARVYRSNSRNRIRIGSYDISDDNDINHKFNDASMGCLLESSGERMEWNNISNLNKVIKSLLKLPKSSTASCAWMEMMLVEATLRNRDRFSILWPIIAGHYIRTLSGTAKLSYTLERRVSGIFKIATRMISRDQMAGPILDLVGGLFTVSNITYTYDPPPSSCNNSSAEKSLCSSKSSPSSKFLPPISTVLLSDVAEHISSGMWRLLTLNVSALPLLRLEHWQVIFDVIAVGAAAGGYASIKSFEAMAWLLHEPRLRAEVPVFCIVGLKPLLCNIKAPVSVSIGAVHLLTHLHTRLEVLAQEEDVDSQSNDADTPALLESCWTPILRALVDGVADERFVVRSASVNALCNAILDKHVLAVPAGVLVNILGEIVVQALMHLGESTVFSELNKGDDNYNGNIVNNDSKTPSFDVEDIGNDGNKTPSFDVEELLRGTVSPSLLTHTALSSPTEIATSNSGLIHQLFDSLTKAFLLQLARLSHYPSFDKLWLRLLQLFGYFLSASHGFDHSIHAKSKELSHAVKEAEYHLSVLLQQLIVNGVCQKRKDLWNITVESVSQFKYCPNILESLNT